MKIHRAVGIRKLWCIRTDLIAQSTVYSVNGVYYKAYPEFMCCNVIPTPSPLASVAPPPGVRWGDPKSYDTTETLVLYKYFSHFTVYRQNHAVANIAERSLRSCLQRKTTFYFVGFSAPLETDSKFVHSTIANNCVW
jgi:hypothetical protein